VPYREEGRHARHHDHDQRSAAQRPLRAGPQPPWLSRRPWDALERDKEFATAARLGLEFGEDFELLEDIGWGEDECRESFELTMPVHDLTELLKRLHDEAEEVLVGKGTERQAREDDRATEERYLRGLDACEELLVKLDESESRPA
jgi:hypothetical protein